MAMFPMTLGEP